MKGKIMAAILAMGILTNTGVAYAITTNNTQETSNAIHTEVAQNKRMFDLTLDQNAKQGGIQTETKEDIQARLNQQVRDSMITVQLITSPIFQNGESFGKVSIYNSEENKHSQVVEITLKESKEIIYCSGKISVGEHLEKIKLDKVLSSGQYQAIATFSNIEEVTNSVLGKTAVEITITIEE